MPSPLEKKTDWRLFSIHLKRSEKAAILQTSGFGLLLAGSVIATGTPAGVGMGFVPPKFLKSGDVVECIISDIGTLTNTVR